MALFSWLRSALNRVQSPAPGRMLRVEPSMPWRRWTEEERERVKRRLEAVGPEALTEDDQVKVVEYLIQRYAPDDTVLKTEGDLHKVLDNMRTKIRRNMAMTPEERASPSYSWCQPAA